MGQYIEIHSTTPQKFHLSIIADALKQGAVIACPTDSGYALACCMAKSKPLDRIKQIRNLKNSHNFSLICRDLSEISNYAKVDNVIYRLLKASTPGGYTFILKATREVPKLMLAASKKTVGIRVPDHPISLEIAEELGEPFITTTLILPGTKEPLVYPDDVADSIGNAVDLIIDGGYCGFEPTTVVDCSEGAPIILRRGSGDCQLFE